MQPRLEIQKVAPDAYRAMLEVSGYARKAGMDATLLELVKVRASQVNACAYCIDMHTKDARANGETEQRLYALAAWRDAPFFTGRERAALEWTEALTLIGETHAPDAVFEELRKHFHDAEIAALSMAIVAINGWNRLMVGFRAVAGTYQPKAKHA